MMAEAGGAGETTASATGEGSTSAAEQTTSSTGLHVSRMEHLVQP